jgi:RNA polymerase sigma-70 factor (sigma-E family)
VDGWRQALAELAGDGLVSLKRQAFLLCGDEHQAEDLVQEAVARAFARPVRAPRPEAAPAYVRTVMVHLFTDEGRRHTRWRRTAHLLAPLEDIGDPADEIVTRDAVRAALSELSPRQRACVVLRYYEDLPVSQVAGTLGVAQGTVKRYLSEAMTRMADSLSLAHNPVAGDEDHADH